MGARRLMGGFSSGGGELISAEPGTPTLPLALPGRLICAMVIGDAALPAVAMVPVGEVEMLGLRFSIET